MGAFFVLNTCTLEGGHQVVLIIRQLKSRLPDQRRLLPSSAILAQASPQTTPAGVEQPLSLGTDTGAGPAQPGGTPRETHQPVRGWFADPSFFSVRHRAVLSQKIPGSSHDSRSKATLQVGRHPLVSTGHGKKTLQLLARRPPRNGNRRHAQPG